MNQLEAMRAIVKVCERCKRHTFLEKLRRTDTGFSADIDSMLNDPRDLCKRFAKVGLDVTKIEHKGGYKYSFEMVEVKSC